MEEMRPRAATHPAETAAGEQEAGEAIAAVPDPRRDPLPDPGQDLGPDPGPDLGLRPGAGCWRQELAPRFRLLVDGEDYFTALRAAMLAARRQILLIGWDFDARVPLRRRPEETEGAPETVGAFIEWLARHRPGLKIHLLRWDVGALASLFRGNTIWTILRWKLHPRITLKLDGAHPAAGSHHQKIVVIDDSLAFVGGIDITAGRLDTRAHRDRDPIRRPPDGRDRPPWHDAISVFDGPAARPMGDLARQRWKAATGRELAEAGLGGDPWPAALLPEFRDCRLAIARTLPEYAGVPGVKEVADSYLRMIAGARRYIYAESQYFASRRIARAIAARLAGDDPPEVVVINPHSSEGWLEPLAMDTARARLVSALRGIDRKGRLSIWHPVTAGGRDIYVHAKLMIVDDRVLRVGSSNLNNRSLGLDSECDVVLTADDADSRARIAARRDDLLAEHLGVTPERVAAEIAARGSMAAAIEALRGPGRSLVPYRIPEISSLGAWLAENQILDPTTPAEVFEVPGRRHLFRGWGRLRAWAVRRRALRRQRRADQSSEP